VSCHTEENLGVDQWYKSMSRSPPALIVHVHVFPPRDSRRLESIEQSNSRTAGSLPTLSARSAHRRTGAVPRDASLPAADTPALAGGLFRFEPERRRRSSVSVHRDRAMRGLSLTGALVSVLVASEIGLLRSAAAFKLTSRAFDDGEPIPSEYLKDDDNISPPLEFEDAPAGELRRGRSARERIRMHAAPSPRAPTRTAALKLRLLLRDVAADAAAESGPKRRQQLMLYVRAAVSGVWFRVCHRYEDVRFDRGRRGRAEGRRHALDRVQHPRREPCGGGGGQQR
jgi:hypothetical protein